ncbi:MAG: GatB/YqeY domain-containing protein [Saprospiraceae bacterium]|nr:GatB/YqeY domain-containing protein [Saprospiraceae bacterium]
MGLEDRIMSDLKVAMKKKDQAALRAIRAVKAAILVKKTDGSGDDIDEGVEIGILQKLVKSRKESLEIYQEQGRDDLAQVEIEEIEIITKYLPEQLDKSAIETIVQQIISDTGASSMKDMGKVMGLANAKLAGKSDGKTVAMIVKKHLQT